jgi:hypothetical protein
MIKSDLTSCTKRVVSRSCWQSQTSSLAMKLQKCKAIIVLSLCLKCRPWDLVSWHQRFFLHQMTLIHRVNAYIESPLVTTCLLCGSLSSILGPHFMVKIAIPWFDKISFMADFTYPLISDQESSVPPCKPASSCDRLVIIAKTYRVDPCWTNLWPFIIPSSLKPMTNFIHLIHLFVVLL